MPFAALVLAVIGLTPAVASACTTEAPAPNLDWGAPLDGASDVPTDVVLLYALPLEDGGRQGDLPGRHVLRDSAGRDVEFTLRGTHHWAFEIVPSEPLAPNTVYTLQVTWSRGSDALQFTTGPGPLTADPPAVDGTLEHYVAETMGSSCDPWRTGTCVIHAAHDGSHNWPYSSSASRPSRLGLAVRAPFAARRLPMRSPSVRCCCSSPIG